MSHRLSSSERNTLKHNLSKRDGAFLVDKSLYIICYLCNKPIPLSKSTIDHITPHNTGLPKLNTPTNLALACKSCNKSKGSKPLHRLGATSILSRVSKVEIDLAVRRITNG